MKKLVFFLAFLLSLAAVARALNFSDLEKQDASGVVVNQLPLDSEGNVNTYICGSKIPANFGRLVTMVPVAGRYYYYLVFESDSAIRILEIYKGNSKMMVVNLIVLPKE